jgi:NTE family protein
MDLFSWLRPRPAPARRRVGLVLSGGAVRGAAHLGVLQVFDEAGIRPDLVVGVSAGALVGGLYCAGLSPAALQQVAREMNWNRLARFVRPHLGIFDISPLGQLVDDLTGGLTLEQLTIPLAVVAVDIIRGELVVFRQGPLARAILASCAIPGLFNPVEDGERLLVDGGALDNLPVTVARDMAADYVIAVDVAPPPTTPADWPKNILEMWSLSVYALMRRTHTREEQMADVLIEPDVAHVSFIDFGQVDALVHKGREAALAQVARIKDDLGMAPRVGVGDGRGQAARS